MVVDTDSHLIDRLADCKSLGGIQIIAYASLGSSESRYSDTAQIFASKVLATSLNSTWVSVAVSVASVSLFGGGTGITFSSGVKCLENWSVAIRKNLFLLLRPASNSQTVCPPLYYYHFSLYHTS